MYDIEDMIKEFWICSLKNSFEEFDFEEFFQEFEGRLYSKLSEHGYLSLRDYRHRMEDYGINEDSISDWMVIQNDFVYMSKFEVLNIILELQMKAYREQLPSTFDDLEDLYHRLTSRQYDESSRS
jgi:hypothetical protein